jgi:hypothetical protein
MSVHKSGIKKGEIADRIILSNCWIKIKHYMEKLNSFNIENWTVKDIKQFLTSDLFRTLQENILTKCGLMEEGNRRITMN